MDMIERRQKLHERESDHRMNVETQRMNHDFQESSNSRVDRHLAAYQSGVDSYHRQLVETLRVLAETVGAQHPSAVQVANQLAQYLANPPPVQLAGIINQIHGQTAGSAPSSSNHAVSANLAPLPVLPPLPTSTPGAGPSRQLQLPPPPLPHDGSASGNSVFGEGRFENLGTEAGDMDTDMDGGESSKQGDKGKDIERRPKDG
ncbi:hypothetical protein FRC12_024365 [Ceratobasidium sp. 428]|nr:hypothetical protein FRC12_024365 [Ceratobasidium sp. 428]